MLQVRSQEEIVGKTVMHNLDDTSNVSCADISWPPGMKVIDQNLLHNKDAGTIETQDGEFTGERRAVY